MKKKILEAAVLVFAIILAMAVALAACGGKAENEPGSRKPDAGLQQDTKGVGTEEGNENPEEEPLGEGETGPPEEEIESEPIDLEKVRPNESGKIMIVMFHRFVEECDPDVKGGEWITTFREFEKLLQTLYDMGYRLISLSDYLDNRIDVPAGFIPMVFTFDDGTAGQFNLINKDGELVANPRSAVGIMEEFYKTHPDFGLEGTFFINMGSNPFAGEGTVKERLQYLVDKGFEIGNHTLNHEDLKTVKSPEKLLEELGGNQKALNRVLEGYEMKTLALPLGHLPPTDELKELLLEGEYQGVKYENRGVFAVGWDPAYPPAGVDFQPSYIHRVRATGVKAEKFDLNWWLENLSREEQYVSDGDPGTITVPRAKEEKIDPGKLNGKKLRVY